MNVEESYDLWSDQYDHDENMTRDLEGVALRELMSPLSFRSCLEIGCGTGKNTRWLASRAEEVKALDLSSGMLARAREKITSGKVSFRQADITRPWDFATGEYELVTFSLVLEHVEQLSFVFRQAAKNLKAGGHLYMGELHPFKQYAGSKARFMKGNQQHVLPCFTHHVSDFVDAALDAHLRLVCMKEYFDRDDRSTIPRILAIIFQK